MRNDINPKAPPPKKTMENYPNAETFSRHFISLAQGQRPERKGNLTLITHPKGGKETNKKSEDKLYMVTPIAQAIEQAKSDLARGGHQETIYDRVMEDNAIRRKMQRKTKARRTVKTPQIQMVTPTALAVQQAKSDLKRGWHQTDVLDQALQKDAQRKRQSQDRKARKAKLSKTMKKQRMSWL